MKSATWLISALHHERRTTRCGSLSPLPGVTLAFIVAFSSPAPTTAQPSSLPLSGAEEAHQARDILRDVAFEEDDRVISHLLDLLPRARNAAELEAAVDLWMGDLDPVDTVMVRHRINDLLRNTPDRDLYEILLSILRHRMEESRHLGPASTASASKSRGRCNDDETLVNGQCCRGATLVDCRLPNRPAATPGTGPGGPNRPPSPMQRACRQSRAALARCWAAAAIICEGADEGDCDPSDDPDPDATDTSCTDLARQCADQQERCIRMSILVARNCLF